MFLKVTDFVLFKFSICSLGFWFGNGVLDTFGNKGRYSGNKDVLWQSFILLDGFLDITNRKYLEDITVIGLVWLSMVLRALLPMLCFLVEYVGSFFLWFSVLCTTLMSMQVHIHVSRASYFCFALSCIVFATPSLS